MLPLCSFFTEYETKQTLKTTKLLTFLTSLPNFLLHRIINQFQVILPNCSRYSLKITCTCDFPFIIQYNNAWRADKPKPNQQHALVNHFDFFIAGNEERPLKLITANVESTWTHQFFSLGIKQVKYYRSCWLHWNITHSKGENSDGHKL